MKIFRFILLFVLIAFLAEGFRVRLLFILDYALIAMLIFAFAWAKLSLRFLELTRHGSSERSQVGDTYEEVLTLRNVGILPKLWLEIRDESEMPSHRVNCVQSLRPLAQVQWRARTVCTMRGRFRIGPMTIYAGDPFGLFRFKRRFENTHMLTVYPAAFDLNHFESLGGALPGGKAVSEPTRRTTSIVSGLRGYRPGDSLNRIHWASSARQRKLIVKEFDFDPLMDIQIFLDMNIQNHWVLAKYHGDGGALPASSGVRSLDSTEEYAVTAAATLAKHFINTGRSVGMVTWGQYHEVVAPDRGERQLLKILEALAVVRALGNADFGQMLAAEVPTLNTNDTVIIITSATSENWVSVLPLLLRKHVNVAVALIESSTFGAPESSLLIVSALAAMNIQTHLLKRGDDLSQALNTEMARLVAQFG
jgi:uncharacterized protein (DUF58 family)